MKAKKFETFTNKLTKAEINSVNESLKDYRFEAHLGGKMPTETPNTLPRSNQTIKFGDKGNRQVQFSHTNKVSTKELQDTKKHLMHICENDEPLCHFMLENLHSSGVLDPNGMITTFKALALTKSDILSESEVKSATSILSDHTSEIDITVQHSNRNSNTIEFIIKQERSSNISYLKSDSSWEIEKHKDVSTGHFYYSLSLKDYQYETDNKTLNEIFQKNSFKTKAYQESLRVNYYERQYNYSKKNDLNASGIAFPINLLLHNKSYQKQQKKILSQTKEQQLKLANEASKNLLNTFKREAEKILEAQALKSNKSQKKSKPKKSEITLTISQQTTSLYESNKFKFSADIQLPGSEHTHKLNIEGKIDNQSISYSTLYIDFNETIAQTKEKNTGLMLARNLHLQNKALNLKLSENLNKKARKHKKASRSWTLKKERGLLGTGAFLMLAGLITTGVAVFQGLVLASVLPILGLSATGLGGLFILTGLAIKQVASRKPLLPENIPTKKGVVNSTSIRTPINPVNKVNIPTNTVKTTQGKQNTPPKTL